MGKRERLDKLLLARGLVATREQGQRRILAGEVLVDDRPAVKAGSLVDRDVSIRLRGKRFPYVSRGGAKLQAALKSFSIDVRDRVVLDVGASTGGFTDCLLAHGARRVYAVDVGYGQLDWKLRTNPRVVVLEKRNIRYLGREEFAESPEVATVDVSFISLRLVLPRVKELLAPKGEIVALIKPQFEVGKGKVGRGGVVRRTEEHLQVIEEIGAAAREVGLRVAGVCESPLLGPKGNKEFFIHLIKGAEVS
ncbi:MAG: TlyA family RNA methyltransferase [Deltaproteobacteria bacterium]|nr:TlyA family RNA methyltransferase [Deltaproteobacteria bacterium]